ncbi:hypothetical protein ACS8YF_18370 [Salinisphaera sp. SWV1]|uniref:hypothetical protein n=1 Tax=Salinisphaera sp. SWV1 TaxID=3454139 RepID=UPI003F86812D
MNNHLHQVDAYDKRTARMSVLIDWLFHNVVFTDAGEYPDNLTRAVAFLRDEMDECEAEQEQLRNS